MLGVGDMALARRVASCGAVGSFPCSGLDPHRIEKAVGGAPVAGINFNFFTHTVAEKAVSPEWLDVVRPYYEKEGVSLSEEAVLKDLQGATTFGPEVFDTIVRLGVTVVSFHFGLPADPLWKKVKESGLTTMASATTVAEAVYLYERGVDVLILQGFEAGGHRGCFLPESTLDQQPGTFALVPQVRRVLGEHACLVAAGGIVDKATVRAAMALGADGVQVGTAFLLCDEVRTTAVHRAALVDARSSHRGSQITNILSGRPARGLANTLMRELGSLRQDAPAFPFGTSYLKALRAAAESRGKSDYSSLWCGQNLSGCQTCSVSDKIAQLF
ncbi:nitronate monooxygenase [Angomonas deanei]|nr:nitronate monooxygenase [Angomonas deanei]|eukprot:EPY21530.1 nitronate monooxygenase [Angomonas deanei]